MSSFPWRDRGYVPDSEYSEEDDDVPSPTTQPKNAQAGQISTTGTQTSRTGDLQQNGGKPNVTSHQPGAHTTLETAAFDSHNDTLSEKTPSVSRFATKSAEDQRELRIKSRADNSLIAVDEEGSQLPSVVDQLQANIELGLYTAKKILQGVRAQSPELENDAPPTQSQPGSSTSLPASNLSIQSEDNVIGSHQDAERTELSKALAKERDTITRNLRQRNAIQLHPYALEDARYRQDLMARGLRPIRITNSHRERNPAALDGEYEESMPSDAQRRQQESRMRSPPQEISRGHKRRRGWPDPDDSGIEGLACHDDQQLQHVRWSPQVETSSLVSPTRKGPRAKGKTKEPGSSCIRSTKDDLAIFELENSPNSPRPSRDDQHLVAPPSPPRSGEDFGTDNNCALSPRFRFPKGLTPPELPTPVVSSEAPPQHPAAVCVESSPSVLADSHVQSSQSQSSPESECSSADAGREKMVRRIKGVLPAAYLRIKKTEQSPSKHVSKAIASGPSNHGQIGIGVARQKKLPGKRPSRTPVDEHDIFVSDVSDGNESQPSNTWGQKHFQKEIDFQYNDNDVDDDINEVNEIDFMLPPGSSRKRRVTRKEKNRQKRLEDSWRRPPHMQSNEAKKIQSREHQMRTTKASKKDRHKSTRGHDHILGPPRLSLLDAPDLVGPNAKALPLFIRVAARRLSARSKQARGSQPRAIQLSTREENEEVEAALSNWHRENTSRPVTASRREERALKELKNLKPRPVTKSQSHSISDLSNAKTRSKSSSNIDEERVASGSSVSTDQYSSNAGRALSPWQSRTHRRSKRHLLTSFGAAGHPRAAQLEEVKRKDQGPSLLAKSLKRARKSALPGNSSIFDILSPDINDGFIPSITPIEEGQKKQTEGRRSNNAPRKRLPRQRLLNVTSQTPELDKDIRTHPAKRALRTWEEAVLCEEFITTPFSSTQSFAPDTFIGSGRLASVLSSFHVNVFSPEERHVRSTTVGQATKPRSSVWKIRSSDGKPEPIEIDFTPCFQIALEYAAFRVHGPSDIALDEMNQVATSFEDLILDISSSDVITRHASPRGILQAVLAAVSTLYDILGVTLKRFEPGSEDLESQSRLISVKILTALVLLTAKAWHLAHKVEDSGDLVNQGRYLLLKLVGLILPYLFATESLQEMWRRSIELTSPTSEAHTFSLQDANIQSLVLIHNVFGQLSSMGEHLSVWDYQSAKDQLMVPTSTNIIHLDHIWHDIAILLPFLEIDASGHRVPKRAHWDERNLSTLVRKLLSSCLPDAFAGCIALILYRRCLWLLSVWNWHLTTDILQLLLDSLLQRPGQDPMRSIAYRSPDSMHYLATFVNSDQSSRDCSEIALKILSQSIISKAEQDSNDSRRIKSVLTSVTPTRAYSFSTEKDKRELGQTAFMQQMDVICVIYASTPWQFRPTIRRIRQLFDQRSSHQLELSVLKRILRFHLSREFIKEVTPAVSAEYREWLDILVTRCLREYNCSTNTAVEGYEPFGATEVQAPKLGYQPQTSDSLRQKDGHFGKDSDSSTRKQLMDFVCSCFDFVNEVVSGCATVEEILNLFPWDTLVRAFNVSMQDKYLAEILCSAINCVSNLIDRSEKFSSAAIADSQDDSQEFENIEWGFLESRKIIEQLQSRLHPVIKRTLSNYQSEETSSDSCRAHQSLVDLWASIANRLVCQGLADWNNYLGPHGSDSWSFFVDSQKTRDARLRFLAQVLIANSELYLEQSDVVLEDFFGGLLDTEASEDNLKLLFCQIILAKPFEHQLFEALTVWRPREQILAQCLQNIRSIWISRGGVDVTGRRCRFLYDLVIQIMTNMVKIADRVQSNNQRQIEHLADVQRLFQTFLPEFNSDLSRLTKNIQFLPKNSNVLTTLRSYSVQGLNDSNNAKRLIAFLQTTLENVLATSNSMAARNYLVATMGLDTSQPGGSIQYDSLPLRFFLLENIFPAYVEAATASRAGSRLAEPVLFALIEAYDVLRVYSSLWGANSEMRLREATARLLQAEEKTPGCLPPDLVENANLTIDFIDRWDLQPEQSERRPARGNFLQYTADALEDWLVGIEEREGSFYRRGRWVGHVVPP
ncbi:MAG: hypothetical protein Q9227_002607 [Pyrenula ochraceoflavens]